MDVDFAFVCDYADVSTKINALGIGFDSVFLPQLPGALHKKPPEGEGFTVCKRSRGQHKKYLPAHSYVA